MLALGALTVGLIEGGGSGWGSPVVIAALAVFPVALAAFVLVERRGRSPMLPPALLRHRTFSGATAVGLALNLRSTASCSR